MQSSDEHRYRQVSVEGNRGMHRHARPHSKSALSLSLGLMYIPQRKMHTAPSSVERTFH